MEDFEDFDSMMGMVAPPPATPELGLYNKLTQDGKYKAIDNCVYWFKHALYVQMFLNDKDMFVCTPNGANYSKVKFKDLARRVLEYYFWMHYEPHFGNDRAKSMGKQVDMEKFLDLAMEYPTIKKLIDNPHELV